MTDEQKDSIIRQIRSASAGRLGREIPTSTSTATSSSSAVAAKSEEMISRREIENKNGNGNENEEEGERRNRFYNQQAIAPDKETVRETNREVQDQHQKLLQGTDKNQVQGLYGRRPLRSSSPGMRVPVPPLPPGQSEGLCVGDERLTVQKNMTHVKGGDDERSDRGNDRNNIRRGVRESDEEQEDGQGQVQEYEDEEEEEGGSYSRDKDRVKTGRNGDKNKDRMIEKNISKSNIGDLEPLFKDDSQFHQSSNPDEILRLAKFEKMKQRKIIESQNRIMVS